MQRFSVHSKRPAISSNQAHIPAQEHPTGQVAGQIQKLPGTRSLEQTFGGITPALHTRNCNPASSQPSAHPEGGGTDCGGAERTVSAAGDVP